MDAQAPEIFTGRYRPNYAHLVCRFRVALKQRALIALHFESDVPAGFKVTVTDPEEGWETAQAEYLRGGHQGHLRGVELRRWHAYASLSVPATALEATEEGKYVVVEVKLQGDRCAFDVAPNGDLVAGASPFAAAAAGRSASDADLLASTRTIREKAKAPPSAINWRLTTYSDAPEGSTTWTEDDARARYLESTVEGWVSGDAQRASLGEEALQRRKELRKLLRTGENAPPTLKEVVDPSAPEGEEPKQLALEPEKARRVRGEARSWSARGRRRLCGPCRGPWTRWWCRANTTRIARRSSGGPSRRARRGSRRSRSAGRRGGKVRREGGGAGDDGELLGVAREQTRGDVGRVQDEEERVPGEHQAAAGVRPERRGGGAKPGRRRGGKRPTRRGGVRTRESRFILATREKHERGASTNRPTTAALAGAAAAGEIVSRRRRRRSTSALSAGRGRGLGLPPPHTLRTHRR